MTRYSVIVDNNEVAQFGTLVVLSPVQIENVKKIYRDRLGLESTAGMEIVKYQSQRDFKIYNMRVSL